VTAPSCARCDARLDPYGRNGGHALCTNCIEGKPPVRTGIIAKWPEHWGENPAAAAQRIETGTAEIRARTEALKAAIDLTVEQIAGKRAAA
jgi:hypothetical protein